MSHLTRRVRADDMRDLLAAAQYANGAFRREDAVEAAPVAFLFSAGRYLIGVPRTEAGPVPASGELVKVMVDEGRWFFDLRGLWIRGHTAPADPPPDGASTSLAWYEVAAEKVVAWDYGTLRTEADDGP